MKNSKLIRHPPDCRRAEPGVPGDRGLRGPREPGDPGPAGGGHAPDAAQLHAPSVPKPGEARPREPQDPRVTGHHSDPQLQGCLPPQVADGGLRGPPEEVKGGGDRGHAPDADSTVRETLGETIVKLDQSVVGRSPLKCIGRSDDQSQYTPTWLNIHVKPLSDLPLEYNGDVSETIFKFNQFCWQGPGGSKASPMLPPNLTEIRGFSRILCQPCHPVVSTPLFRTFPQAPSNLTEIEVTRRYAT